MSNYKVLISCDLGEAALERFAAAKGIEPVVRVVGDEAALIKAIPGHDALIVRSNVKVNREVLEAADKLAVVGRAGIGVDNIDMEAATRLGVAVLNAPSGNSITTGEHAIALILALARNIAQADRSMHQGKWEKKKFMGREVSGKVLGIVGAGRIGSVVAERALGLKMRVVVSDPFLSIERAAELGVERVGLDELFSTADFITVHTPLTNETRGLIGAKNLALCKKGVMVVNCARGAIVDEDALCDAIKSGKVAGAALDVFPVEPPPQHPLYTLDQVVMTPHLGASTFEAQQNVAIETAENIIAYLSTGTAANLLNAPASSTASLGALAPYLELAERLGRFLSQSVNGVIDKVNVTCCGETAVRGSDLITSSAVKGLLSRQLTTRLNLVNAMSVAAERSMHVSQSTTSGGACDFSNLVRIEVTGAWGVQSAEATLLAALGEPRLVRFNEYRLDAKPKGHMVLIFNDDVPGVIGAVGTCLGEHGLNIAGFYNGRGSVGGDAIILVNVDSSVDDATLEALRALKHIKSAMRVEL